MGTLVQQRLPASSLVEVTVASVILVLMLGLALGSMARLAVTGPQHLRVRAQQLVARVATETIREHHWQTQAWQEGALGIVRDVRPYPQVPYLYELRVVASAHEHEVAHYQQLIYDPGYAPTP